MDFPTSVANKTPIPKITEITTSRAKNVCSPFFSSHSSGGALSVAMKIASRIGTTIGLETLSPATMMTNAARPRKVFNAVFCAEICT